MIESKNLLSKNLIGGSNKLRFKLFPDPVGHFGLSGWLGVAAGAALQAVRECSRRCYAGILIRFYRHLCQYRLRLSFY